MAAHRFRPGIPFGSFDPVVHDLCGGEVVCYSAPSPARDKINEDAFGIIPVDERAAVIAVADGPPGSWRRSSPSES